jgi:putative FmdB family regulatory protein
MPIYEYHCGKCEDDFEVLVFGKDEVVCPTCGGCVERLMSSCSFKSAAVISGVGHWKIGCSTCATCH